MCMWHVVRDKWYVVGRAVLSVDLQRRGEERREKRGRETSQSVRAAIRSIVMLMGSLQVLASLDASPASKVDLTLCRRQMDK